MSRSRASTETRIDEWNHVEKPLLDQLKGLDWEINDITDKQQQPPFI